MDAWLDGWFIPICLLAVAVVVAEVTERQVLARLSRLAAKTSWNVDEVFVNAVRGLARIWVWLVGIYFAAHAIHAQHTDIIARLPLLFRILQIIWLGTLTVAMARIATGMFAAWSRKHPDLAQSTILSNLLAVVVYVVGILVVLESQGISITPVLTALGVGGLAVALALQDTLANVFAGIHIILAKDISPGEFVRLDSGQEGYVENIGWRNTTIRTLPNDLVVVPNSKLSAAVITNLNRPSPSHPLVVPCSVAYGSDLERVEAIAVRVAGEVMAATTGCDLSEPPVVRFSEFADSGLAFNVIIRVTDFPARFLVRHVFIKALHAAFNAEGITIPYPTRTVIHHNAHV